MPSLLRHLRPLSGFGRNTTSHREKLLSALGAFVAIALTGWTTTQVLDATNGDSAQLMLIASSAASAVLLFAVPHGALSQPWPLLGGHFISAIIGVSCRLWLPDPLVAAGAAVGLSVGAMYYLRCIHPPGGATALTAVIGGDSIAALGYGFVFLPVMLNAFCMLLVAVLFNLPFHWRRYPEHLAHLPARTAAASPQAREVELTQEDFAAAMQELDSYVDITSESLALLLELAKQHAEKNVEHPQDIVAGHFYSNGKLGKLWSVRQVIDDGVHGKGKGDRNLIIYKVIAGDGDYATGLCSREEFRHWARFEVENRLGHWVKAGE